RVDRMLAAGWVEEVRAVLAAGVAAQAPGLDAVGYREVVAMLEGRLPQSALHDAIERATRRYAKRQETWFRNQLRFQPSAVSGQRDDVWVVDATQEPESLAARIHERWQAVVSCRLKADSRMRIGITRYPTYGGSGAVATELGLELGRRRHDVHISSYASPLRPPGGLAHGV